MRLPRDLGGEDLVGLLARYGYRITRQTGSHLRLTSTHMGVEHHVTVPKHTPLRVGTLGSIMNEVASYLEIDRKHLIKELFA
jgi:predicted RNA binding protein YcfA (HicA-like mRNA interferase family)